MNFIKSLSKSLPRGNGEPSTPTPSMPSKTTDKSVSVLGTKRQSSTISTRSPAQSARYFAACDLLVHTHKITKDYKVSREVLGVGINGKVLACYEKTTMKKFALKILPDGPNARREVELHYISCRHRNIVKIFRLYENTHRDVRCLMVIMECMDGGPLFARIKSRANLPFTEREAAQIMHKICRAVNHLHAISIAHRDIKPENLLYNTEDNTAVLKLTDFGFAKQTHALADQLTTPCYSPYFVAPEILAVEKYDKSCDLWALGVVMYILLCGYPPFYSAQGKPMSPGMRTRIKTGQYQFPSPEWDNVSDAAKSRIDGLLKTDPKLRLTVTEVMEHVWITDHKRMPETPLFTPSVLLIRGGQIGRFN